MVSGKWDRMYCLVREGVSGRKREGGRARERDEERGGREEGLKRGWDGGMERGVARVKDSQKSIRIKGGRKEELKGMRKGECLIK